jgi:serine/threonine-protein kinase
MATVHVGRLLGPAGFGRTVAIKRLHDQYARDPDFVAMLLDEARLTATIRHPNVVPTLDIVAEEDELLVVMEYVEGDALGHLLKMTQTRGQRIPPHFAAAVVAQALHGLHAAHDAKDKNGEPLGIVHRDVSPQNILVGVDGIARVLDFGIAKAASRSTATEDGQVKGKTAYMAPEQLQHGSVDRRTDVFAAAVVLWEVLTNKRLFFAESPSATVARVLHEPITPPILHAPDLPPALSAIVHRALDRDPSRRFASAEQMAFALEEAVRLPRAKEIGGWVQDVARPMLDDRAVIVRQVEMFSVPPIPVSTPRGSALAGAIEMAERKRLIGEVATDVGANRRVDPALLTPRSQPPAPHTPRAGNPTPRSGGRPEVTELASISNAPVSQALAAKTNLVPLLFAAFGAVALVIAVSVAIVMAFRSPTPAEGAGGPPEAPTPVPMPMPMPPPPLAPVPIGDIAPPPTAAPPPATTATPPPTPHPPVKQPGTKPVKPRQPAIDCERDPWIIDEKGLKRIRPECK